MQRAVAVAETAAERAAAADDEADAALARTVAAIAAERDVQGSSDDLERLAREALPLLEAAEDDDGLVDVWYALAWVHQHARTVRGMGASDRNGHPVRPPRAARPILVPSRSAWRCRSNGPRPASEALATRSTMSSPISRTPAASSLFERYCWRCSTGSTRPGRSPFPREEAAPRVQRRPRRRMALPTSRFSPATTKPQPTTCATPATGSRRGGTSGALDLRTDARARPLHARPLRRSEPLAQRGRDLGDPEDVLTQLDLA